MIRTVFALVVLTLSTPGCGGPNGPTAPSLPEITAPATPQPADGPRSSLSVNGQIVAGRYSYWLQVAIAAGAHPVVIHRIDFQYPERAQNSGFQLSYVTMQRVVPPGTSYTSRHELLSTVPVSQVTALVSFADSSGQSRQVSASATAPPIVLGTPSPTLRIAAFSVSEFMEGTSYAYWPKLTLTASPGQGRVTVTRLQFDPPDLVGPFQPHRRDWLIPAGATLALFHGEFYGEPEFYLTSASTFDQLTVTVSYVDDDGRSGEATAVAAVER